MPYSNSVFLLLDGRMKDMDDGAREGEGRGRGNKQDTTTQKQDRACVNCTGCGTRNILLSFFLFFLFIFFFATSQPTDLPVPPILPCFFPAAVAG